MYHFKYGIMKRILQLIVLFLTCNCSLEEEILDEYQMKDLLHEDNIGFNFMIPAYSKLHVLYSNNDGIYILNEGSSDELMIPTDAPGDQKYAELYQHSWKTNNALLENTWKELDKGVGLANSGIQLISELERSDNNDLYQAELRFLRAFFRFWQLDFFRQVPMRDEMDMKFTTSPEVWKEDEITDWLISELLEIIPVLKERPDIEPGRVTKAAAKVLLAKIYLNSEVYNQPARFEECLEICLSILQSGYYDFSLDYFSIFNTDNTDNIEHIFVLRRDRSGDLANLAYNQTMTLPYADGWGMSRAVPDFVYFWDQDGNLSNGINSSDLRFLDDSRMSQTGYNLGLLIGQQYNPDGSPKPGVYFTVDFNLPAQIYDGVRVLKYERDVLTSNPWFHANNDIVVFRYSDVVLMAAEAKFRLGQVSEALADINSLRQIRNAPLLTSLSEQDILNERAFELYWEGWRRQDLVRFGQFSRAWGHKEESEEFRKVFPIPDIAFHSNPNLVQNPGY
jgi:hypothetical protein